MKLATLNIDNVKALVNFQPDFQDWLSYMENSEVEHIVVDDGGYAFADNDTRLKAWRTNPDDQDIADMMGIILATEAILQGGSDPCNSEGDNILPDEPQKGDYSELEDVMEKLGAKVNKGIIHRFETGYTEMINSAK